MVLLLSDVMAINSDVLNCIKNSSPLEIRSSEFDSPLPFSDGQYSSIIIILPTDHTRWIALFSRFKELFPRLPILAILQQNDRRKLQTLIRAGLEDFLIMPFKTGEIQSFIRRHSNGFPGESLEAIKREILLNAGPEELIGEAPNFTTVLKAIPAISRSDLPVLICGETGTGKEMIARAVHYLSKRAEKPFLPFNCGCIPDTLVESELFGHARGAFTGAAGERSGILAGVNGGTLFLDEINSMSPSMQVKLLRVLEEKKHRPLGSSRFIDCDMRVISASNAGLEEIISNGLFRRDLYYRLNALRVDLPPLRERPGDIPLLAGHFLQKTAFAQGRGVMALADCSLDTLQRHDWPGNVRELKHCIERAVIKSSSHILRRDAFDQFDSLFSSESSLSFREQRAHVIGQFEKKCIAGALLQSDWNITQTARRCKIDRRLLQRLIKKYELQPSKTNAEVR